MRLLTKLRQWSPRVKNASVALMFLAAYSTSAMAPFMVVQPASAAPLCSVDSAGANDEPGQKDLTQMCIDPVTGQISWNWDELSVNGANTLDGCALFDTDNDGFANRALCVSSTDGVAFTAIAYTCNDSRVDRCAGADAGTPASSVCSLAVTPTQPFGPGANSPNDLTATCIPTTGDSGGGTMIDVCSYPSGQPNSDPSDCVMYRDNSARIEVRKVVDPASDPGLFNLRIGATTYASNVGDGGTTGEQVLTSGSIVVSETAGTSTSLASYTTAVVCRDGNGTGAIVGQGAPSGSSSRQLTIVVADASDIVCVFTNTRQTGTVTLIKSVTNDNGGTLGVNDFGLTIGGTSVTSGQTLTLPAGVPVSVNETGAAGYTFVSLSGTGCPTTLGGTVTPVNNQNITCTITNDDQPGTLIVNKVVVNNNGGTKQAQDFQFQVNGGAATAFEADGQNEMTVNAGTYNVTELADSQYTTSYENCTSLVIPLGGQATCTVTNDDKPATLTLTKIVVNNNGGILTANDFPVFLNDQTTGWGTRSVSAGTYSARETTQPGYVASAWSGDCSDAGSVTLLPGESKECIITNDDQPAQLSGVKYEVNADGTTVQTLSGWTICLDTNANGQCDVGESTTTTGADGGYSFIGLNVGTYNLAETNNLGGSIEGWTQIFSPQAVDLSLGEDSTDNNFGNFKNGSVSGVKFNDMNGQNGRDAGEPGLQGWTIFIDGNGDKLLGTNERSTTTNASGAYTFTDLAPGTYSICEVPQASWVQTYPGLNTCQSVVIETSGESNPNKNFGNRGQGTIEVVKNLLPANDPGLFDLLIDGQVEQEDVGDGGTTESVMVWAGEHEISEGAGTGTSMENYTSAYSCSNGQSGQGTAVDDINIEAGEAVVCTFTNTRDKGTITVVKEVTNDNGGSAQPDDFTLYVNAQEVMSGTDGSFNTNVSYDVSEDDYVGYSQESIVCMLAGVPISRPFMLQKGQHVTCTITNDDVAPKLTVIKHVVNTGTNNTSTAADFTMQVTGTNVSDVAFDGAEDPGTTVTLDAGAYSVSEGEHDGYTMTMSGACAGTIAVGEEKTCTVTNTAILYPGIEIVKDGPDVAHEGDEVTYTYEVTNTGNVPFPRGAIQDAFTGDDTVYVPVYVSGDSNDNEILDPDEVWQFELTYTIPDGQTDDVYNVVTVCGYYYDGSMVEEDSERVLPSVCDEDDHTLDVLHPSLRVVKSGPANVLNGTTATYTFTVTNTGDTPLDVNSVIDDVAGLGVYKSGDANDNDLLDLTETWIYQATKLMLTDGSVKNTVTVCAVDELDGEVCGDSSHTTIVYTPQVLGDTTPKLENTGTSVLAVIAASMVVVGLSLGTLALPSRRRAVEWSTL